MKHSNLYRAMLGGFVGTLLVTAFVYLAPLIGMPRVDIAGLLGSLFGHGTPALYSGLWWTGMAWHFLNGTIIFSLIYAYVAYGWLAGEAWFRGLVWGVILWLADEVIFMPLVGSGLFNDHAGFAVARVFGSLVVNGIYGVVLGAIAGPQPEHEQHVMHPA